MSIKELLRGRVECECGKAHLCPIKDVIIEDGAIATLSKTASEYKNILLVADENTYAAAGDLCARVLGKKICGKVIFGGEKILIPNEAAIEAIENAIKPDTELILGIGSGVINDLCKHTSFKAGLPYQIVATAPSMDGYASVGSALILGGMKVTLNARVPEAIIADTAVLAKAPMEMIIAGYGDIIGKYSCLSDWRLAALVRDEYICDFVVSKTYATVNAVRGMISDILNRDKGAVGKLMEALVAVGILMAYVGNSRPASGSEHHLSHFFEIVGIERGEEYLAHGIDVFYSSALTALIRDELLTLEKLPTAKEFDREKYECDIKRIYGTLSEEVLTLQKKVGFYEETERRLSVYREKWLEICRIISDAPRFTEVKEMLHEAGLPYSDFLKLYGDKKITEAQLYGKDLKDRYTVLWTYFDIFG